VLTDEPDDEGEIEPPVGVFGLRWRDRERRAHLVRVGLAPEARGLGLAKPMLKAAERLARGRGAERLTLNVYGSNTAAQRAYESAGFFVREIAGGGDRPDDVVVRMLKPLGPAERPSGKAPGRSGA
jgi:ribosomal protein S18 acetylase RimI-like enzyme